MDETTVSFEGTVPIMVGFSSREVSGIASCSLGGVTCFKTVVVCYQSLSLKYL